MQFKHNLLQQVRYHQDHGTVYRALEYGQDLLAIVGVGEIPFQKPMIRELRLRMRTYQHQRPELDSTGETNPHLLASFPFP